MFLLGKDTHALSLIRGLGSVTWNWCRVIKHLAAECFDTGGTEVLISLAGLLLLELYGGVSVPPPKYPNWKMSGMTEVSYLSFS